MLWYKSVVAWILCTGWCFEILFQVCAASRGFSPIFQSIHLHFNSKLLLYQKQHHHNSGNIVVCNTVTSFLERRSLKFEVATWLNVAIRKNTFAWHFIIRSKAYLLFSKIAFHQRAHHLLWRASGADVRENIVAVSLLCITDPSCMHFCNFCQFYFMK